MEASVLMSRTAPTLRGCAWKDVVKGHRDPIPTCQHFKAHFLYRAWKRCSMDKYYGFFWPALCAIGSVWPLQIEAGFYWRPDLFLPAGWKCCRRLLNYQKNRLVNSIHRSYFIIVVFALNICYWLLYFCKSYTETTLMLILRPKIICAERQLHHVT